MSHATLDMYHLGPAEPAKDAFWARVGAQLTRGGLKGVPNLLTVSTPWDALLTTPGLLLGQTCGYPMMTIQRDRVQYVATPCYDAPGCHGPTYSSAVMVRADDRATDVESLRGRTVAFNASHSQSGYNSLRVLIAPFAVDGRFFGETLETGSHAASFQAVLDGKADCCATDSVYLALLGDQDPGKVSRARRIAWTPPAPALPFVTAPSASRETVAILRRALLDVAGNPANRDILKPMRIKGVQVLDPRAYDAVLMQENLARRFGVTEL
ncbi:MAG: PhnD/SsuA/transferrin family substrate-binding protein [Alphaproteobacteria bacterium]